jgi:hypothetical protein
MLEEYRLKEFTKAEVYYIPNFFDTKTADLYMSQIVKTVHFEKKEKEGRMTALHGSAVMYKYALNEGVPLPWTTELKEENGHWRTRCVFAQLL